METDPTEVSLSVLLPTLGREEVLLDTIRQLLGQVPAPSEILVIDQSASHERVTEQQLTKWEQMGAIAWHRLSTASQPGALNRGLELAKGEIVLCLDDDIAIDQGFLAAHLKAFDVDTTWAVAGQVLQPGEQADVDYRHREQFGLLADFDFCFRSSTACNIKNGMSGNLSIRRKHAIAVGGFDENFIPPVSYRFDNEFCKRLVAAGGRIRFEPNATIHHLRASRGGTRTIGSHLDSPSPIHGCGDYYFALRCARGWECLRYILRRPLREVCTRFHLRHPWWIPVKLIGEIRAVLLALRLHRHGPKYLSGN